MYLLTSVLFLAEYEYMYIHVIILHYFTKDDNLVCPVYHHLKLKQLAICRYILTQGIKKKEKVDRGKNDVSVFILEQITR